jgi:hypothetical protein
MVVSTWPDTFEIIEALRDPVQIRFSERISERPTGGPLVDAVQISPETGEHRVKHTRSGLEISLIGGFRADQVYRVRVLPTIKDMFGTPMTGPFELVFSTGGEFQKNVLAGVVLDRITGEPVEGARVEAREQGEEDAPVHVASTDTAGIYLLRFLPGGAYQVSVFDDLNRNREMDFSERQGETTGALGTLAGRADTVIGRLALLQPDTTPSQLIRVEAEDSALLRLTFDEYLYPGNMLGGVRVVLTLEEEVGPAVERLLWQGELDSIRAAADSVRAADALRALTDSLNMEVDSLRVLVARFQAAGDTTAADSVDAVLEAEEGRLESLLASEDPEGPEEEEEEVAQAPGPVLPEQFFYAILREPLAPSILYQLTVTGVRNIASVTDGGGEAGVTWTPPETPPDTAGVPPDTAAVPPDTANVPPDTALMFRRRGGS